MMSLQQNFPSKDIDAANKAIETHGSVRAAFSAVVAEEDNIRSALRAEERRDRPDPGMLRMLRVRLTDCIRKNAVLTAMDQETRDEWNMSADKWEIDAARARARDDEASARNADRRAERCRLVAQLGSEDAADAQLDL